MTYPGRRDMKGSLRPRPRHDSPSSTTQVSLGPLSQSSGRGRITSTPCASASRGARAATTTTRRRSCRRSSGGKGPTPAAAFSTRGAPTTAFDFWFGQTRSRRGGSSPDSGAQSVNQELMAVQNGQALGPYPWNALLVPSYKRPRDAGSGTTAPSRKWRAKYRYPDLRVSDPRDFMVDMETSARQRSLPVLSRRPEQLLGRLRDHRSALAGAWKRRAARLLPFAEGLAAVASVRRPGLHARPARSRAAPTGGCSTTPSTVGRPNRRRAIPSTSSTPNGASSSRASAPWQDAERLFGPLAAGAGGPDHPPARARELVVVNPLAHARTDLVLVPRSAGRAARSGRRRPAAGPRR
jgi:hypothetical protein